MRSSQNLRYLALEIGEAVQRHRTSLALIGSRGRMKQLQRLAKEAGQLHRTIDGLDPPTRRAVVEPFSLSPNAIDPRALVSDLKMLALQAEHASKNAGAPRRGPRRLDPLRQLAADIGILWSLENPSVARGIKSINGRRSGPMLDFVWKRLRRARVRVQSKDALGKLLYPMRNAIAKQAAAARRRQLVTRKFGTVVVVSRE